MYRSQIDANSFVGWVPMRRRKYCDPWSLRLHTKTTWYCCFEQSLYMVISKLKMSHSRLSCYTRTTTSQKRTKIRLVFSSVMKPSSRDYRASMRRHNSPSPKWKAARQPTACSKCSRVNYSTHLFSPLPADPSRCPLLVCRFCSASFLLGSTRLFCNRLIAWKPGVNTSETLN